MVKEVDALKEKVWKLRVLKKIIKKPEIKDKFEKYVDRLQTELGDKAILLQNMEAIEKKKNEIKRLKGNIKTIQNSKTGSCAHNLQAKLHGKREELDDLETRQFELELPKKTQELNSLFSKMQEINKRIELFYSTNESKGNSVDVNENSQGFQYFIKNSNTSNDRGLG
jgi:hypothetical protein